MSEGSEVKIIADKVSYLLKGKEIEDIIFKLKLVTNIYCLITGPKISCEKQFTHVSPINLLI